MVAPRGKVKLAIFLETPARFVIQLRVTGKVAEEDAVEKAVSKAGDTAWKCLMKFNLAKKRSRKGSTIKLCIARPNNS